MKKSSLFVIMLLLLPIFPVASNTNLEPNEKPTTPVISGPGQAKLGEFCTYTIVSVDPQDDDIYYEIKCSDDPPVKIIMGPYDSGQTATFEHCWCDFYQKSNPFTLLVKAEDINGHESDWERFDTNLENIKGKNKNIYQYQLEFLIERLIERFPILQKLL